MHFYRVLISSLKLLYSYYDSGSRGHHNNPLIVNRSNQQQAPSSASTDFTTSLLSRVTALETEGQSLRRMLAEKLRAVEDLERENASLRLVSGRSLSGASAMQRLQKELDSANGEKEYLRGQIEEMTQFLSDYGLAWVGKDRPVADEESSQLTGGSSAVEGIAAAVRGSKSSAAHQISFADFSVKVNELNSLIRLEPALVKTEYTGAGGRARLIQAHENVCTPHPTLPDYNVLV